jgi:hypothetical protein
MAEDRNKQKSREDQLGKQQVGRSGRNAGHAPQTTETGAANSGGQTKRAGDQPKNKKEEGGR